MPNGARVKVAGRVILVHTPPTRSGVRVMFITAEDEFGLIDMVLFPAEQENNAKRVLSDPLCAFYGILRRVGTKAITMVIQEILNLITQVKSHNVSQLSDCSHST